MSRSSTVKVMISGLPGKMATEFVRAAQKDERIWLVNHAFTGEQITENYVDIEGQRITLLRPSERKREEYMFSMVPGFRETIIVDFTESASINENIDFYVRNGLYFVSGTTGGDREKMIEDITESDISAVIAPNMAIPIVVFMEMIKQMADQFPGVFKEFDFEGWESHQWWKKGLSGTMDALLPSFEKLGASITKIDKIRDKEEQLKGGIPEEFLEAHGYHRYKLLSESAGLEMKFEHNVNGRAVYALGAIEAVLYLDRKRRSGVTGKTFGMMDVIKNL